MSEGLNQILLTMGIGFATLIGVVSFFKILQLIDKRFPKVGESAGFVFFVLIFSLLLGGVSRVLYAALTNL